MHRINDPYIPRMIEKWLEHANGRVVANALESICEFKSPSLVEKLVEFLSSNDNRIRANAVKGIYPFEPALAERHIEEMVSSSNIALQDSGLYLLKVLRPSNLGKMLKIAEKSRFATIRLKALDIKPPEESEQKLYNKPEETRVHESEDDSNDIVMLSTFFVAIIVVNIIADSYSSLLLSFLFVSVTLAILIFPEKTRVSIQKLSLSTGLLAVMAMGCSRLLILPAIMGVWTAIDTGWSKERFIKTGTIVHAWFFLISGTIVTQIFRSEQTILLSTITWISKSSFDTTDFLANLASRQARSEGMILTIMAIMTILILKFESLFPLKQPQNKHKKRLLKVTMICTLLVVVINAINYWGLTVEMKMNGISNVTDLIRRMVVD